MSRVAIDRVRALETAARSLPQVGIATSHVFHAGLYARTITIPAEVLLTGALIKRATLLIISGHVAMYLEGGLVELAGYNVLPASAGRKQAFLARSETCLTMVFPSRAESVAQAEGEFTDEVELLFSRDPSFENTVIMTGE